MSLISMKCPSCGALLKYEDGIEKLECEFCGTVHLLELNDEDRKQKAAKRLAEEVRNYRTKFFLLRDAESKKKYAKMVLSDSQRNSKILTYAFVPVMFLVWLLAARITKSFFSGISNFSSILFTLVTFPLIFAEGVGLSFGGVPLFKHLKNKGLEKINKDEAKNKEAQTKYDAINAEFDVEFIPQQYRNDEALLYIINMLDSQRAFSIQQAINLYEDKLAKDKSDRKREEELVRMKMIQQQNEELLRRQQTNSKSSGDKSVVKNVLAGGAFAAGEMITKKVAKDIFEGIIKK